MDEDADVEQYIRGGERARMTIGTRGRGGNGGGPRLAVVVARTYQRRVYVCVSGWKS